MKINSTYIRLLFILIGLFFLQPLYSQQATETEKAASQAMDDGDYFLASDILNQYITKDSTNLDLTFQLAESFRLSNNYPGAAVWYSFVFSHDSADAYPLSCFWLAMMLKSEANYDEAMLYLKLYLKKYCKEKDFYCLKAEKEIVACASAQKLINNPIATNIFHLDQQVNTPYSEFGALQLGDSLLLFSTLQQLTTNDYGSIFPSVYLSRIGSAKMTMAGYAHRKLWENRINNSKYHTANLTFNENYTLLIYTQCQNGTNGQLKCDIYACEKKNNEWQSPYKLNINAKGFTSTQPCFAKTVEGDEVLYFVSDRKGGFGGNDIWYSVYKNNRFYEPVNAGNIINTPGDEITPFYHSKTQILYFSSDWHGGLGGFDIFKSAGGFNAWTLPANVGYPLNSACNEMYFVVNNSDTDGYFTSNRPGSYHIKGETCCNDIYSWEMINTRVDSIIQHTDTIQYQDTIRSVLPLTLFFHNDEPDPATTKTSTDQTYQHCLSNYLQMKEEYSTEFSRGLKGKEKAEAQNSIRDFFSNYVEKGFQQLEEFLALLKKDLDKGNRVAITIKGYASPLNNSEYNVNLSKRRISSLLNFIRVYEKGYFVAFMDSTTKQDARLKIYEEPFGKSKANPKVSDNPNDPRNSIYNPEAALERKIQILYYDSFSNKQKDSLQNTTVSFDLQLFNIGNIPVGEKKVVSCSIRNTGQSPLYIKTLSSNSDCFSFDFSPEKILPGGKSMINILFTAPITEGSYSKEIYINANTSVKPVLTFQAQVIKKPQIIIPPKKKTK